MKAKDRSYRFEAVFIPQDEGGFTVEVPDLPGCVSEGENLEEAEENVKEAIALYLEALKIRGLPLPPHEPEKSLRMSITIFPVSSRKIRHA